MKKKDQEDIRQTILNLKEKLGKFGHLMSEEERKILDEAVSKLENGKQLQPNVALRIRAICSRYIAATRKPAKKPAKPAQKLKPKNSISPEKNAKFQKQISKLKSEHKDEIQSLKKKIENLESQFSKEISQKDSEVLSLQNENIELRNQIRSLESEKQRLSETIDKIPDKTLGYKQQIEELNRGLKNRDSQIAELTEECSSKDIALHNLKVDNEVLKSCMDNIENSPLYVLANSFKDLILAVVNPEDIIEMKNSIKDLETSQKTLQDKANSFQNFISRNHSPQEAKKEKAANNLSHSQRKLNKRHEKLRDLGLSETQIEELSKQKIAFFGVEKELAQFRNNWEILNQKSEFFDINKHHGTDVENIIIQKNFDFVILTRMRSHGEFDYVINKSSRKNDAFIDKARACFYHDKNIVKHILRTIEA